MAGEGAFLGALTSEEARAFSERARTRRFPRGSTLFLEGDRSDSVVVIVRGRVKVFYLTDEGREIVLAVREPGELLGELSAIDGEPRSATATAVEPVEVLSVAADEFRSFLAANARVSLLLLQMLSARLREADRKRVEFGAQDTVGRVVRRLVELADRFGQDAPSGVRIDLPLSQEELAGWVGASRKAVTNALQRLRERGLIETRRRRLVILDLDALRRRAGS